MIVKIRHMVVLSMISLFIGNGALADSEVDAVKTQAKDQVITRQQTQEIVDEAAKERLKRSDRIDAVTAELKAVRRQRLKTDAYVADLQFRVEELERRIVEIERIKDELDPFLDDVHERLFQYVEDDLPFLQNERQGRLYTLERSLNRYGASVPRKVSEILETLGIEARYGTTADVSEGEVNISGARKQVRLLRLGRISLFALSLDGRQAWKFDSKIQGFQDVSGQASELNKAAEIAARHRVVELVDLPIGGPEFSGHREVQP